MRSSVQSSAVCVTGNVWLKVCVVAWWVTCAVVVVCAQAAANFEFVLPLATVVVGVVPPSSQQYSVDLLAVPWLRLDALNNRYETANL